MTRSRRRLLWITSLAAAALLIAGTWFYQAYFSSTNAAIRHAEAFLFRRMSVTQLVEQGELDLDARTDSVAIRFHRARKIIGDDNGPTLEQAARIRQLERLLVERQRLIVLAQLA